MKDDVLELALQMLEDGKRELLESGWVQGVGEATFTYLPGSEPVRKVCAMTALTDQYRYAYPDNSDIAMAADNRAAKELTMATFALFPHRTGFVSERRWNEWAASEEANKEPKKHPIAAFNDDQDTVFNDVMAIYDHAILSVKQCLADSGPDGKEVERAPVVVGVVP